MSTPTKPTVFISYSHKDEEWKDRFIRQLRALEQAGRIVVWDDRKIDGGDKWYPEIKEAMEQASVAVCLISPDYLASDFCIKEEIPFLLQRCEHDGMILIPFVAASLSLDILPNGLLVRAELSRVVGDFASAKHDLDDVIRIATRSHMGLHEADCHLEYARLYLAQGEKETESKIKQENKQKAREHWATAKEMIERMGYHRRDKDVREIEAQLAQAS